MTDDLTDRIAAVLRREYDQQSRGRDTDWPKVATAVVDELIDLAGDWSAARRHRPHRASAMLEKEEHTMDDEPFFHMGDALRRMYLESVYDTVEEFLTSLECPDFPEPMQFPRYW
jgi:hypothetical protein